jgi:phenylpropionate dioxygenase-like ring-hydroxylating dioxygenase large terminal subunit
MPHYPSLEPECYYAQEIYLREVEHIFSNLWIFVGLTTFLQKEEAYIARRVAGVPVFVQKSAGQIRAFLNQCPHRLSPIYTAPFGIKKITCPFHGWSFDGAGKLYAIPNEHLYNFTPVQKESLGLKSIQLKTVGKFIFINFSEAPLAIEAQFDSRFIETLVEASQFFDDQVAYASFPMATNWKLNMEVIKDPNHIPFVHGKSFTRWLAKNEGTTADRRLPTDWQTTTLSSLQGLSYTSTAAVVDSLPWYRAYIDRQMRESTHLSWYLFPNTHFASVRGDYFFIQHYDPSSEDSIDFHLWVFTSKKKNLNCDFTALLRALITEERKIIEEDSAVLSRLQESLGRWSSKPTHGAYENNIAVQNRWYLENVLGEAGSSDGVPRGGGEVAE